MRAKVPLINQTDSTIANQKCRKVSPTPAFSLPKFCTIHNPMSTSFYSVGRSGADPVRQTEIKIKRSRFIASLAYAATMEEAKEFIGRISKEHKRATHNCWAYVVGDEGEISHASDAGEPAGTAGKPMLNVLKRHEMTCVAAVVTRYYGGVKLGVRGLIEAYGQAVEEAVSLAPLFRLVPTVMIRVTLDYAENEPFLSQARALNAQPVDTDYQEAVTHEMAVETASLSEFRSLLEELAQQGKLSFEDMN